MKSAHVVGACASDVFAREILGCGRLVGYEMWFVDDDSGGDHRGVRGRVSESNEEG